MRHRLHYELHEARALLPWVRSGLAAMRAARERLTDAEAHRALTDGSPSNGGGSPGKQVGEAFLALRTAAAAFAERDIVVRDLDRGLIDFPAVRDGQEVYLCWVDGEDDIAFWHELDAGYAGRQALE
jgi:hypothetical protein